MILAAIAISVLTAAENPDLAQIKNFVASRSLVEANQALIRLHMKLYKKAGIENCRPPAGMIQQLKQPNATAHLVDALESSLAAADYSQACKEAMVLGVGLQQELATLTPLERLAQQEKALPLADANGRSNLVAMEQLAWSNYEAGQLAKAESLALDLDKQASAIGPEFMADVFVNSARTLIGLIRLHPTLPSRAEAVECLRRSAEVQPTMMLLQRGPAVRLADGLWKAGEQAAVVEYLGKLQDYDWKPDAKLVARWYEDARAGKRPDFFRGASQPIGR